MILLWMAYAMGVALLLALAAAAAERLLRLYGRQGRGVWVAAIAGAWLVPIGSWWGQRRVMSGDVSVDEAVWGGTAFLQGMMERASALPVTEQAWFETAQPVVLIGWGVAAAIALGSFALAVVRLSRRARGWPEGMVEGEAVLLSRDFGPAVIGVRRSRIVLPRWVLGLDTLAQRMVLRHEAEHLRARDTTLLAVAALAVLAAPWNLPLWWHLRRLRWAVELDCDRRVIRGGAPWRRYGRLLLTVGERLDTSSWAVAALAEPPSFLERRLKMITERAPKGRIWQALGLIVAAGVLTVAACGAPAPTPFEPDPADAVTAQGAATKATEGSPGSEVLLRVPSLDPDAAMSPLIYIDGVRVGRASESKTGLAELLGELDPEDIERIELIKGTAAENLFGADGAGGVIQIYTKGAGDDVDPERIRLIPSRQGATGAYQDLHENLEEASQGLHEKFEAAYVARATRG